MTSLVPSLFREKHKNKDCLSDKKVLRVQNSTKWEISTFSELSEEKNAFFLYRCHG